MATRAFSFSCTAQPGDSLFPLPVVPIGLPTVTAAGSARAFTMLDASTVSFNVPLVSSAAVVISGTTYAAPTKAEAPGTPITGFSLTTGGTVSNAIGAINTISSLTDNSGGTSGGNTVAPVTDIASAANAIATIAGKVTSIAQNNTTYKNAVASLGAKQNEVVAILEASKIAT